MTYNFRYSKFAPNSILNFIFIALLWIIGLLLSIVILFYILNYRILRTSEVTFWKQHQKFVLYLILILPIIFSIIFSIISFIMYRHLIDVKDGVLNIFNNYAILYYKGNEIRLEKNNFSISSSILYYGRKYKLRVIFSKEKSNGDFLHPVTHFYTIKTESKKYKIYSSIQEAYELTTFLERIKHICPETSLDIAMKELIKLSNI